NSIHVESEEMVVDATVMGTAPAWRPETGCLFFGKREEYYFAWLPSVPQGDTHVTITLSGGEPQHYTGIGYHDHNWGNISMLKLMHDWYWARGTIANYTLIASYITAEQRYGIKALLARLLRVDGAYLRFTGQLSLEHYQADILVETQRDEALWELMYFGHVTRK